MNTTPNLYYRFIEILKRKQEKGFQLNTLLHKHHMTLYLEWEHETGLQTISPPFESVIELKDYLNCFVVDSVKHSSGLSDLLRNIQNRRYGWRIVRDLDL